MRLLALAFVLAAYFPARAQEYTPLDSPGSVTFKIKNFGVTVEGAFQGLTGKIQFDPHRPESAVVDVAVEAGTLETGIDLRNKHVKKKEYLDVVAYPRIYFKSTEVKPDDNANTWRLTGDLTMKQTTRKLSFPFTAEPQADGTLVLAGEFKINRRDFGVGGNSLSLADGLTVFLRVAARKQP